MLLVNLLTVVLGFGFFALCGYFLAFLLYSPKSWLKGTRRRMFDQIGHQSLLPKRVINLLNGDINTAGRLFIEIRTMHPDKSEKWCWETILCGLQRDRSHTW
jgi:hypothetical protein